MVVVLGLFCNPSDFSRKEKTQPHRKKLQCPKLRYKIRVLQQTPWSFFTKLLWFPVTFFPSEEVADCGVKFYVKTESVVCPSKQVRKEAACRLWHDKHLETCVEGNVIDHFAIYFTWTMNSSSKKEEQPSKRKKTSWNLKDKNPLKERWGTLQTWLWGRRGNVRSLRKYVPGLTCVCLVLVLVLSQGFAKPNGWWWSSQSSTQQRMKFEWPQNRKVKPKLEELPKNVREKIWYSGKLPTKDIHKMMTVMTVMHKLSLWVVHPKNEMGICRRRTQESDNTRDDNHLDNVMLHVSFVDWWRTS